MKREGFYIVSKLLTTGQVEELRQVGRAMQVFTVILQIDCRLR